MGTPTDSSLSGTIEEIEHHIKAGKPVMLFFRKFNDITRITAIELAKLEAYKSSIQNQGLFKEYDTERDFESIFSNALELFLVDHWQDSEPLTSGGEGGVFFRQMKLK